MSCTKKKGVCPNNGFQQCNTCDFNGADIVGGRTCFDTGLPLVICECSVCIKDNPYKEPKEMDEIRRERG